MVCDLTNIVWHPRHHHEVIGHSEDVVDVELGEPRIEVCVEQVHKLYQLNQNCKIQCE